MQLIHRNEQYCPKHDSIALDFEIPCYWDATLAKMNPWMTRGRLGSKKAALAPLVYYITGGWRVAFVLPANVRDLASMSFKRRALSELFFFFRTGPGKQRMHVFKCQQVYRTYSAIVSVTTTRKYSDVTSLFCTYRNSKCKISCRTHVSILHERISSFWFICACFIQLVLDSKCNLCDDENEGARVFCKCLFASAREWVRIY